MLLVGRRSRAALLALVLSVAILPGPAITSVEAASTHVISIGSAGFSPSVVNVNMGDSIRWVNDNQSAHDVVFRSGPASLAINSGATCGMSTGQSYTFTVPVTRSGDYEYYSRCDGASTYLGTIHVNNVAPFQGRTTGSTAEDKPFSGSFNVTDANNDPLTYEITSQPSHGVVILEGASGYNYTPDPDYNGPDSFGYRAFDGFDYSEVEAGAGGVVYVTVASVNDAPIAVPHSFSVSEDSTLQNSVQATDIDSPVSELTYAVGDVARGTVRMETDGTFTFEPPGDFFGETNFTYTAGDGLDDSQPGVVTITVNPVNDAPVALDVAYNTREDTPLSAPLNARDIDDDPMSFTIVATPSHGTVTVAGDVFTYTPNADYAGSDSFTFSASDGQLSSTPATARIDVSAVNDAPLASDLNVGTGQGRPVTDFLPGSDAEGDVLTYSTVTTPRFGSVAVIADSGQFTYTPSGSFTGVDSFTYQVSDGAEVSSPGTVRISVSLTNTVPEADEVLISTDEDLPIFAKLAGYDADGDSITYSIVVQPMHGSLSLDSNSGRFTYSPHANYFGADEFKYQVSDGQVSSRSAKATITISSVNDGPTATSPLSLVTNEDTSVSGVVAGTDPEGDTLYFRVIDAPARGSVAMDEVTGAFTYTPSTNLFGADSFTYAARDVLAESAPVRINLDVRPVNDAPVSGQLALTTNEDIPISASLPGSDVDGDVLTYHVVSAPTRGTLSLDQATGAFTYQGHLNLHGSDSFTYRVRDGQASSGLGQVSLTIVPVNDIPVANPGSAVTAEDTPVSGTVTGSDVDGDVLTYEVSRFPRHGGVDLNSTTGAFTYTPAINYYGADSFEFRANDGALRSAAVPVSISVSPVNDAPVALNGEAEVAWLSTTSTTGKVRGTDVDGDTLSYTMVTPPRFGAITFNGTTGDFRYTPNAMPNLGYRDSFTFKVNDGALDSNEAQMTLRTTRIV